MLANWIVSRSRGPSGRLCTERLIGVAEVVEGVDGRRGRVVDRLEAGVVEAGGRLRVESVKKIEPYWPTCGKTVWIIGVVGLAGERARGELAGDVQGVARSR